MEQLLENTLTGGTLILMTAALRHALKGRLHPDVWLVLWGLCLARLLTPVRWTSGLSLYALAGLGRSAGHAVPLPAASPAPSGGPAVLPWLYAGIALLLGVRFIGSWLGTRREVGHAVPLSRRDPRRRLLPRWVGLREGPMKGAPLTFGALRPTVVLAPGLRGRELECVLVHEGVHARRRDNLWHYVVALALVFHWFNPAVWLMAALLRRDIELSCDRAALNILGAARRAEYASALVSLSTQAEGPAFCRGFGPKRVEERIIAIMKYKKTSLIGVTLALVMAATLTLAFASTPKEAVASGELDAGNAHFVQYQVVTDGEETGLVPEDGSEDGFVQYYVATEDGVLPSEDDVQIHIDDDGTATATVVIDGETREITLTCVPIDGALVANPLPDGEGVVYTLPDGQDADTAHYEVEIDTDGGVTEGTVSIGDSLTK